MLDDGDSEDQDAIGDRRRNQRETLADIESHKSKASSSSSEMKGFVKFLNGNETSSAIAMINYVGYTCYLVMVGLTVYNYIQVRQQLTTSFDDN